MAGVACALFIAAGLVHLVACAGDMEKLKRITKPMLMPLLALWYLLLAKPPSAYVLLGLLFGWAGDVLLMNPYGKKTSVLGGVCFGVGHILYILYMAAFINAPPLFLVLLLVVLLAGVLYAVLHQTRSIIPILLFPAVAAYALLLCALTGFAALYIEAGRGALPFFGALLFMVSDYILGNQMFRGEAKYSTFLIMLTYIGAQTLLMLGFV